MSVVAALRSLDRMYKKSYAQGSVDQLAGRVASLWVVGSGAEMTKIIHVADEGDNRRYFTQIPNLIDDLGLSPYAFRLYVHLKRVAGEEGSCWQSVAKLAETCKMSQGAVTNARRELEGHRLISVSSHVNPHGGKGFLVISILDKWAENMTLYRSQLSSSSPELASTPDVLASTPDVLASSPGELASSPGEIKNNPLRRYIAPQQVVADNTPTEKQKPSSKNKRDSKISDPRINHPAIVLFRELVKRFPRIELWDKIIAALGETPDRNRADQCWMEWLSRGYNPNNISWTEWYVKGIPSKITNKSPAGVGNPVVKRTDPQAVQEMRKILEERHAKVIAENMADRT